MVMPFKQLFFKRWKVGKGACDNPERFCVVLRSIKFLKEFLENGTRDQRSMFASCVPGTVY